jgi:hypothetical protein
VRAPILKSPSKIADLLNLDFSGSIEDDPDTITRESAADMLRKKPGQEPVLRQLFHDHGAALLQNVKLEPSSRHTDFDEDQFVRYYPYLPHLIDLSIDILAGIRLHPNAPKHLGGGNSSIVRQSFDMLASDRTRLADQPVGVLVSVDKIYELVEGSIPPEKQRSVRHIADRFDDKVRPGMEVLALRVAKAICLMEFVKTDLPRTAKNIAALLVQHVTEAPPIQAVDAILDQLNQANFIRTTEGGWQLYDYTFDRLLEVGAALEALKKAVGTVNPRLPGWHNDLIQIVKKWLVRPLAWYSRPLNAFYSYVSRTLEAIVGVLDRLIDLPIDVAALQTRLAQAEERLELMQGQITSLAPSQPAANPGNARSHIHTRRANGRTAYVVGLFGSGRQYLGDQIKHNIGERAKYFRDGIRLHLGPTPMIYSGHATIRYVCRGQHLPAVTSRMLESVGAGFADLIFIYRHPLDSLLTNWVWWREHIRDFRCIAGISQVYANAGDLCAELERNFLEFKAFAAGDLAFFGSGLRFLSLAEFVEETQLYLQSPETLSLRLEDFMIDPLKEFSKTLEVMSVERDRSGLHVAPPKSKPYGYLAVKEAVPQFRSFIDGLDAETKRRIAKIGYSL